MKADWGKGYGRKGAALHGLDRWTEAIAAYDAGLKMDELIALTKASTIPVSMAPIIQRAHNRHRLGERRPPRKSDR